MPAQAPQVLNKHTAPTPGPTSRPRVYIGRGSPYGNPFVIGPDGTRDEVCDKYEAMVNDMNRTDGVFKQNLTSALRGKDLVCFCKPQRCHGDFLLRLVNT